MPATGHAKARVVNVAAEEARRFGGESHLTRDMRDRVRRSAAAPSLLAPDALAAAVREQDEDERRKHADEDRRAKREYDAFLAGRAGRELPEDDYDVGGGADVDDADDSKRESSGNPVRDRLEREAAATRGASGNSGRRDDALERLRREAEDAARNIRDAAPQAVAPRPTHERMVSRPVTPIVDRESQLLTDDIPVWPTVTELTARQCTLADVDRLWDWIRTDAPSGTRFIGHEMANSQQLHALLTTIAKGEATRASLARSIYLGDLHAGFVVLLPVLLPEKVAAVHMYLRAESRALLPGMLPSLLQLAEGVMPGLKLAVMGMSPSLDKLLHPYGFRMQTVFLQE